MHEVSFRIATGQDVEGLIEYMRVFYAIDGYAFDESVARESLSEFVSSPSLGTIWLIELDLVSVGYVALTYSYSFEYHGRNAYVDELYIDSEYRGHGIGTKALDFVLAHCRTQKVKAVHLEVERGNVVGQSLYRKTGFVDHDRFLMTKWL